MAIFALLVPAIVGGFAGAMASFVGRAVIALGIGFVTYKGIDVGVSALQAQAISAVKGMPGDVLGLISFLWLDKCLTIIFSAITTALAMKALGGSLKKMVFK